MRITYLFLFSLITSLNFAQEFTRADTLRGSITPERAWWDVQYYDLDINVDPVTQSLKGSNTITYMVLEPYSVLQIDLQAPMKIEKVIQNRKKLKFTSEGDTHFIKLRKKQKIGKRYNVEIFFSGKPVVAVRPPWDGGFTWEKDSQGKDFIANSNQGIGASIWWPLKDHPSEEPDRGMTISVTAPKDLMDVSNGQLEKVIDNGDTKTWVWKVVNPINAYGVNISIADYVHFEEIYEGEKGDLKMDYYVLRENEAKARNQFKQAPLMIEAFEHWFGPYPFYEDGYKLIEVPYLGMEHQSSVTYGNNYQNGYLGKDLTGSGWGMEFDFIIIHESAHEWFANNITNNDVADMWVHEGFTNYAESLYVEYHFGKKAGAEYVIGLRKSIFNNDPILGKRDLNNRGSNDMYNKGGNILHTLRQIVKDDEKWRQILRGMNKEFYHQTVSSKQIENYISEESGINLDEFFNQYLRTTKIPNLQFKIENENLKYRYENIIENFDMPLIGIINGEEKWIYPTADWKDFNNETPIKSFEIKKDFYVFSQRQD